MRPRLLSLLCVLLTLAMGLAFAQTKKPLTNDDVLQMVKTGLSEETIIKVITASDTAFDTSAEGTIALKNAGVSQKIIEAMVAAETQKKTPNPVAVQGAPPTQNAPPKPLAPAETPAAKLLLKEGTEVPLQCAQNLSSKTAAEGDPVHFTLAEDLKVGDQVVAKKGSEALATVSHAKKAGMMGKAGELNIRLEYVKAGETRVKLRGTQGREGQGKEGTAVALTVLFGPIGLIKHGKNVEMKEGAPLKAYVDQDTFLAAVK